MPCVVWSSNLTSSLDKDTEAYQFLQDINKYYGYEKVVVVKRIVTICRRFFKKQEDISYEIYIKISDDEYQRMMVFQTLGLQDIECYLLGYLNGMER